ncbi:hypothetical protein PENTCL1PPCAC_2137, partial [Pristionchus entomophagus]
NSPDPEETLFSSCILSEFGDGWTQEVIRISHVSNNPIKKCDEDFQPMTVLDEKGRLHIHKKKKDIECKARSIEFATERSVKCGNWTNLSYRPSSPFSSDIIQTQCFSSNKTRNKVEDFLHIQVVKKEVKEEEVGVDPPPSVYIFVVDSVSNSQALRSLPKTVSLLQKEHQTVNLRHVNKVGENSHPNGIALFFGKVINLLDRSLFGMKNVDRDWDRSHCYRYLDEDGFVLSDFTKRGYVSLMAEDWASGVFNYPNCWGFQREPVTHYMRPFQVHYERHKYASRRYQGGMQCLETHTFMYQYLDRFIDKYPRSSKIAMTWASNVAHDDANRLFHFDAQLFNFFRDHREELDKSFVFLMGDHGIRFGAVRHTWIGNREINNPMLFISVPSHLRERINPILRENGEKLLTSFDIHASFVDILNGPTIEGEEGPKGLRGNSLFRPLPEGERSCRTLPIPLQFCLCEWNRTEVEKKKEGDEMGEAVTELLNQKLRVENIADYCEEFTYLSAKRITRIDGTRGIHSIHFRTEQCGAEFKAMVRVMDENGSMNVSLVSDAFIRTNSYGKTAECMDWRAELRPICCCK